MTETENVQNTTKTFKFTFPTCTNEKVLFKLEVPVEIPHDGSTRELVQRVINMFHIPVYLEDELNEELAKFVSEETKNYYNERDERLINQLKNSELNVEGIIKGWEKSFKENVMEFAEQKGTSDEEVFAAAYHKLVHSPALDTILSVENSYAKTYIELWRNRDADIEQLTAKQTEEMEEKIRQLNITTTEEEINQLAMEHFEQQALLSGRWGSQLDALWQTQRAHFRSWLMATLDEYQTTANLNTPSNSPLGTFSPPPPGGALPPPPPPTAGPPLPAPRPLEESFTIHLGSQLKQTHNIRIVAADLLDLCTPEYLDSGLANLTFATTETSDLRTFRMCCSVSQSPRLQSALALYSGELCGAVVAGEAGAVATAATATATATTAATDLHFPHLDTQLARVADALRDPLEQRRKRQADEGRDGRGGRGGAGAGAGAGLAPGDVYITRHANLPGVHVVFHLVVDNHRPTDITSRHPAILGLRSVLKAACANDVTHLALPLLLRHEFSEDMTLAWCARRAELVLKCAKGFMLEAAGWGGAELRTLTVALPRAAPPALFAHLAALLPALFRLPCPVYMRSPPRP